MFASRPLSQPPAPPSRPGGGGGGEAEQTTLVGGGDTHAIRRDQRGSGGEGLCIQVKPRLGEEFGGAAPSGGNSIEHTPFSSLLVANCSPRVGFLLVFPPFLPPTPRGD